MQGETSEFKAANPLKYYQDQMILSLITKESYLTFWKTEFPNAEDTTFLHLPPLIDVQDVDQLYYIQAHMYHHILPLRFLREMEVTESLLSNDYVNKSSLVRIDQQCKNLLGFTFCAMKSFLDDSFLGSLFRGLMVITFYGPYAWLFQMCIELIAAPLLINYFGPYLPMVWIVDLLMNDMHWIVDVILILCCFSSNSMVTMMGTMEYELKGVLNGTFPRSQYFRNLVAFWRNPNGGNGTAATPGMAPPGMAPQQGRRDMEGETNVYVRCPLCREQTVRAQAIKGMHTSDDNECCCCMDAKSTVAFTCGHLCVCEICFEKLQ